MNAADILALTTAIKSATSEGGPASADAPSDSEMNPVQLSAVLGHNALQAQSAYYAHMLKMGIDDSIGRGKQVQALTGQNSQLRSAVKTNLDAKSALEQEHAKERQVRAVHLDMLLKQAQALVNHAVETNSDFVQRTQLEELIKGLEDAKSKMDPVVAPVGDAREG